MLSSGSHERDRSCSQSDNDAAARFQRGSLQKRKSGGCLSWICFWWQDGHRKSQILGPCVTMSRPEALSEMARVLQPINDHASELVYRVRTVGDWIRTVYFPRFHDCALGPAMPDTGRPPLISLILAGQIHLTENADPYTRIMSRSGCLEPSHSFFNMTIS
jgi:hypothetical protein